MVFRHPVGGAHGAALAAVATLVALSGRAAGQTSPPASDPAGVANAAPVPVAVTSEPGLEKKSLDECVATALAHNIEVRTTDEDIHVAEAERAGTRGAFGPKIHVDASYQRWNEAYVFSGFPVHDTTVWNVTATATQPITTLFAIYDAYKVRDLGVDIAEVKREATRRQTAYHVVEGYYRLLQAERLVDVAAASVEQLQGQLRQANSFHANGTVSKDDVLRAELAAAGARQRQIQAKARVTIERARLAVTMGLSPDSAIDATPLPGDAAPAREVLSVDQAEKQAEVGRVELREIEKRLELAGYEKKVATWRLAPQVNVVGAYIHNEGSLFSQVNAGYLGATASWDVWDWGTTTSGITAAKAHVNQAILAHAKVDDQIKLEVRQAFVMVTTASEAMEVARAAVASAEENYRLVKKRYDASAATSFDVVDAEGLLTQARGEMQTTLYDFVIARAALRSAMGTAPESLGKP